ncbi:MAG: metallophosphoesterase [Acidobacteria bacterium]|nr:metallophosphoesterase [Acidobacteriota bacterium]
MYLFNELLLSVPLVIYVGWRLRRLIPPRALKNLSTALLALLAAGYPAAESLSHGAVGGAKKVLVVAGYYALPLVLYFTLTVLLVDLVIAVLRLSKAVSRQAVQSEKFRHGRLALVLALPVLVVAAGIVNSNVLRVREYTVEIPRRSSAVREVKVVFAADLHLSSLTPKGWLAGFVDKVNAQKPDIVLIGGDILEGHGDDGAMGVIEAQLRRLEVRYGVFAVPGNHEGYARTNPEFFDRSGIRLLQDTAEKIDDAFTLIGRKDGRSRNRKSVEELLLDAPGDLPIIMLEHRPAEMERVGRTRVDLHLSGHTHNGQLFPANFITQRQYGLSWGHRKIGNTDFIVTSGAQLWGPPVRTVGASEILVIRVRLHDGPQPREGVELTGTSEISYF